VCSGAHRLETEAVYSLPRREQVATLEQNLEQGWVKLETRAGQKGTCQDALARSRQNVERQWTVAHCFSDVQRSLRGSHYCVLGVT
jgi:hypothetical protein